MSFKSMAKKLNGIRTSIDNIEVIPTGLFLLDNYILVKGGIPCGRAVEYFGASSSGKSSLAISMIANAQKQNIPCVIIDDEETFSLDIPRLKEMGIDYQRFINQQDLLIQTEKFELSLENMLLITEEFFNKKDKVLLLWDSVAAKPVSKDADVKALDKEHIARKARLMSRFISALFQKITKTNVAFVAVNQVRKTISANPYLSGKTVTPGGITLPYLTDIRFQLVEGPTWLQNNVPVGKIIRIQLIKSRYSMPVREIETRLHFTKGFDNYYTNRMFAKEQKLLTINGAHVIIKDKKHHVNGKDTPEIVEKLVRDYLNTLITPFDVMNAEIDSIGNSEAEEDNEL